MGHATLHDVAKAAGVSHTTVSWSLRGDPRISPATRQKVAAAAAALGYVPNEAARCLACGRTMTVAVVSPSFSPAFESEILHGIENEVEEAHAEYGLVQFSTGGSPERNRLIHDQLLRGNKADAVICLCDPPDAELRAAYAQARKPLVLFDEEIADASTVRGDSLAGARLATALLLEGGCRRPGIVSSRTDDDGRPSCDPGRWSAFYEVCRAAGLSGDCVQVDSYHFEGGRSLAAEIARRGWDGAFCAAGDMVAIGLMAGCRELGIAIPGGLRLVGYDNLTVSAMVTPALTTIAQPLEAMGRAAVDLCFELMADGWDGRPRHRAFAPSLVRRESA